MGKSIKKSSFKITRRDLEIQPKEIKWLQTKCIPTLVEAFISNSHNVKIIYVSTSRWIAKTLYTQSRILLNYKNTFDLVLLAKKLGGQYDW